jgi:hypothetical protein
MSLSCRAGHVFHLHAIPAATFYSLYNTIEPDVPVGLSTHPIRQLLDQYLDPTLLGQFLDNLFLPGTYVPPSPIPTAIMPTFFQRYASIGKRGQGSCWASMCMARALLGWFLTFAMRFQFDTAACLVFGSADRS